MPEQASASPKTDEGPRKYYSAYLEAKSIHYCLAEGWTRQPGKAIESYARAKTSGKLPELREEFERQYGRPLEDFIEGHLSWTNDDGLMRYLQVLHPARSEAIRHARDLADQACGWTNVDELAKHIRTVAGVENGQIKSPEKLLEMRDAYNQFFAQHYYRPCQNRFEHLFEFEFKGRPDLYAEMFSLVRDSEAIVELQNAKKAPKPAAILPAALKAPEGAPAKSAPGPGGRVEVDQERRVPSKKGLIEVPTSMRGGDVLDELSAPVWSIESGAPLPRWTGRRA